MASKVSLETPVQYLKGVGPIRAGRLARLGIETVGNLLEHWPFRYDYITDPVPINSLKPGETSLVFGQISSVSLEPSPKKRQWLVKADLTDSTGRLKIVFFNQRYLYSILKVLDHAAVVGKLGRSSLGVRQFNGSSFFKQLGIYAVYPETSGVTSSYLRRLIGQVVELIERQGDFLPASFVKKLGLVALPVARRLIHQPHTSQDVELARQRLAFDELLVFQLRALETKRELARVQAPIVKADLNKLKRFVSRLPFKLTQAQRVAAWQIIKDLAKPRPMNRLLQGDVGSGKTVVAALATLAAASNGYQSVWLAPTEILANQHWTTLKQLFRGSRVNLGIWTAGQKQDRSKTQISKSKTLKKNQALFSALKSDVVVGTHALLGKVMFKKLGLVIIDEQHRFGVKQRSVLLDRTKDDFGVRAPVDSGPDLTRFKDSNLKVPHFLAMTATPIPRTLALTLWSELDLSVIDQLPSGRRPVKTQVIRPDRRAEAYDFIRSQVKLGRQVFIVVPLIEEASARAGRLFADIERKSVLKEYRRLSQEIFPDLKVGLIHGKLSSKVKNSVMSDFQNGVQDILVATSLVEVGVDVPNTSVIMVENADQFGLAQLHQLRGRVGRADHQAYCLLLPSQGLPGITQRLKAMERYQSGFKLAEVDLLLRGPGEVFGLRQHGLPDLKIASLTDSVLINKAQNAAKEIIQQGIERFPELSSRIARISSSPHLD